MSQSKHLKQFLYLHHLIIKESKIYLYSIFSDKFRPKMNIKMTSLWIEAQ